VEFVWIIEDFEEYTGGSNLTVCPTEALAKVILGVFLKEKGWKSIYINPDHEPKTVVAYWMHKKNGCMKLHKCLFKNI